MRQRFLRCVRGAVAAAAILVGLPDGSARAEGATLPCDCDRDCAGRRDVSAELVFDDAEHRLWYEVRFWQGRCDPRLSWCLTGDDWYDLMALVLSRPAPAELPQLCQRLWHLGRDIGFEWARDNDTRRIDTDDLDNWSSLIEDAADPWSVIEQVEAMVQAQLR